MQAHEFERMACTVRMRHISQHIKSALIEFSHEFERGYTRPLGW